MTVQRMIVVSVIVSALLTGSTVWADTSYTNTTGTGQWSTGNNWDNGVPVAGETAIITNELVSGTNYTVEVQNVPNDPLRLTCSAPAGKKLTLNIHTNLTLTNTSNSDGDWGFGPKGNVEINIFSNGVLTSGAQVLGANSDNDYTIYVGGRINFGTVNNKRFRVYGDMTIRGELIGGNRCGELANWTSMIIDGGLLYCDQLTCNAGISPIITNGGVASVSKIYMAGTTWTMTEGAVTNRYGSFDYGNLWIGGPAGGNAPSYINMSGGTWRQEGPVEICIRPRGYLNISGTAQFLCLTNIFVGSNDAGNWLNSTIYGYVNVSGGQLTVTNSDGGASLLMGNITGGFLDCSGGTTIVDRIVLSNPDNALNTNAVGKITMSGGVLTVLHALVATNDSFSQIQFDAGTLNLTGTDFDSTNALIVGDGTSSAVLGLLAGSHSFVDGLNIASNATLAAGGVGAMASPSVTGDVTLEEGAKLHCDFSGDAGETITITGTLTLPITGTVELNSIDGTIANQTTLATATSIPQTDVSGWTVSTLDGNTFRLSVVGTSLVLTRNAKGTTIFIN